MIDDRRGEIVTFYSYQGGTGRTMALANIAWILAANGRRVLAVDWDIGSPGLHRYFAPFLPVATAATPGGGPDRPGEFDRRRAGNTAAQPYSVALDWPHFPGEGALDFVGAGPDRQWRDNSDGPPGVPFPDALRADWKAHYDYVLVNSPNGRNGVAADCTTRLPDLVVDCFLLSELGIDGAVALARRLEARAERPIRVLPVPMRVDLANRAKASLGRAVAKQRFANVPAGLTDAERDAYWAAVHVPYQVYYAYEEALATFGDLPGSPGTLLGAYEVLTGYITNGRVRSLPPMDEGVRARINRRFARPAVVVEDEVVLRYAPADQVWTEWIEHVLIAAGIRVVSADGAPAPAGARRLRPIRIISAASAADDAATNSAGSTGEALAIYVSDIVPLTGRISMSSSAFIAGLTADAAIDSILRLVGRPDAEIDTRPTAPGPRFPGQEPVLFNVPARNVRFTGRESDLLDLRARLRAGSASAVVSVALHGMGGIGKTQVAMEYAHRFASAYDVVWWINADPCTFIDSALIDLGSAMGLPSLDTGPENSRAALAALAKGEPYGRWLIIFDNAEDPAVGQFLPPGKGHVILTARGSGWGDRAQTVQLDVFQRPESVAHLIRRVPSIKRYEADRVAAILGDLPIAIAAAGAWLSDTGMPVEDYLREIERQGPRVLPVEGASGRSVEATWDLSLQRLKERSAAAYRLLQLCSVLAPEISLDLIYSDELAQTLLPFDPEVAERLVRGALVQQINRLALLRLDRAGEGGEGGHRGQVLIHSLLQHVVRSRMSEAELAAAQHEIHTVLAASRPDGEVDDPETWQGFRTLWPHLEVSEAVRCPDESVRRLLIDRVRYLWLQGELAAARERAERTDRIWQSILDSGVAGPAIGTTLRRQLLHLRTNLAGILRDIGEFRLSYDVDEQVVGEQRDLLGPDHPHTLMTAIGLASDLRALGQYHEALVLDQDTYSRWLDGFGERHLRTLAALSNLAVSYRLVGDWRKALELDDVVYQGRRPVLGDTHPSTLNSAGNLGRDLRDAGRYDRSVALLRGVVESLRNSVGPDSRQALNTRVNLAISLRLAGAVDEAGSLLESAYKRLSDAFGAANPDTLVARLSWSVNLWATGDHRDAMRELAMLYALCEQVLGTIHPYTLACGNNLAVAYRATGDLDHAVEYARLTSSDFTEVLGSPHPYTLAARMNLAVNLAGRGELEEAYEVIRDVVELAYETLGRDHPHTLRCLANMASILRRLDRTEPGVVESAIYDRLVRQVGINHPDPVALRDRELLHWVIDPNPY